MADEMRKLTPGEIVILRSVYGERITYPEVRVSQHRWFWPLPDDRAMAPNGNIYFPGQTYAADFAAVGASLYNRSVFVHEGAHLYQWYGLGRSVWLRGSFDRDYGYELVPGKRYEDYGLEQMGSIAQDYFTLRSGVRSATLKYPLSAYAELLPVTR
ncbi:MAG: hypothetical protein ACRYG4_14390 [Janthinobacterium lividum]